MNMKNNTSTNEQPNTNLETSATSNITADIILPTNDETSPPKPFNSAEYEDDDIVLKNKVKEEKKMMMNQQQLLSAMSNNNEEEVINEGLIERVPRESIEEGEDITNAGREVSAELNDGIESFTDEHNDEEVKEEEEEASIQQEDIHIPVAWIVDDDNNEEDNCRSEAEVYIATPTLPWWKQRRTKVLLGVVIVIVSSLAVALGVSLSRSPELINNTDTPSISLVPTSSPTIYKCFDIDDGGPDGILYNAVRAYVSQDCSNNIECAIGQAYGWPINSWCVGKVRDMSYLFHYMDTFNEDINGWDTSSVTSMSSMFEGASSFNQQLLWNTSSVTTMAGMFYDASSFNQELPWDTANVYDMSAM